MTESTDLSPQRFTVAVRLLADESPWARMGGILELERTALDDPRYADSIAELLSAYVRESASRKSDDGSLMLIDLGQDALKAMNAFGPGAELRIACNALSRIHKAYPETILDIADCCLLGIRIIGFNAQHGYLNGIDLRGCLMDSSDFTHAHLVAARFDMASMKKTTFSRTNAPGAVWSDALLHGSVFSQCTLTGAVFRNANLTEADFSGATLKDVDLTNATLLRTDFRGADLQEATIVGCDLSTCLIDSGTLLPRTALLSPSDSEGIR
jgi:uncharacterized protein YjbI with pentapeptide repeats